MRIAIVGGGAAGMMCMAGLVQAGLGSHVTLFEKNKVLGAKVAITGGGRCNVTTGLYKKQDILPKYIRGSDRFSYAYKQFSAKQTYKRFEQQGCQLKIEKDMRVFPISNKSKDVIDVFDNFARHIDCHLGEGVIDISKVGDEFIIVTDKQKEKQKEKKTYSFDKVVICVGGNAYRHTGSTGDGYTRAEKLGHNVTQLGPSLSSFLTQETWIHRCSGVSFANAGLIRKNDTQQQSVSGPFLCTHFGFSGPVAFVLAAHCAFEAITKEEPFSIFLKPDSQKSISDWDKILVSLCHDYPKKQIQTVLGSVLPKSFVQELCAMIGENFGEQQASQISRIDRQQLAGLLGNGIPLTLIGRRPGDEFVTAGGVATTHINPKTMESTICPGLFFGGEVLDIDGVTGGYNLQVARSTGMLAAHTLSQ